MTMQGGGCRIEELERLDGRKFALDLILNHLEGRITLMAWSMITG